MPIDPVNWIKLYTPTYLIHDRVFIWRHLYVRRLYINDGLVFGDPLEVLRAQK